jgi:SpoVK/Ycf46/Vps4 family AAA+-type ATPase
MDFSDMDLEINYGKKFLTPLGSIIKCLEEKKSGLYIFHGPPGTGKTSYIKYLTGQMDHKKFIFIPNTMISNIFSPKFVEKLYSFRNSVLVLEDAEICLFKRDGTNNELVSGILNITDGLLKDLLNISIIVTFNSAETRELDEALLRKGRLHFMHKFDLLSEEDAKLLAKKLNKKKDIAGPTSLADVYNLDESTGLEEEKAQTKVFGFAQR